MEITSQRLQQENDCEILSMTTKLSDIEKGRGQPLRQFVIEPMLYLEIPIQLGEDRFHRKGYIVHVDPVGFQPLDARYYHEEGEGTYREIPLTKSQFAVLQKFTQLCDRDLFYKFYNIVMQ